MWLPEKLYESLPVFYVTIGVLFLSGALYVGIDHWLMAVHLGVGILCIMLGVAVASIRRRARATSTKRVSRNEQLFV